MPLPLFDVGDGRRHIPYAPGDGGHADRRLYLFRGPAGHRPDARHGVSLHSNTRPSLQPSASRGIRPQQRPGPTHSFVSVDSPHLVPRRQPGPVRPFSLSRPPSPDMYPSLGLRSPANAHRHGVGVDPEEQLLGELVRSERHQQRRGRRTRRCSRRRRFLQRLSDRTVRSKLVGCLLSGAVLTIILSIYLSLALQNRRLGQHFHVIFILIILLITIIFCHSLVRLCMLALFAPPPVEKRRRRRRVAVTDPVLHADPESLAHVLPDPLETETDEPRLPPPAYGRWRGSVRIDPNFVLHMPPSHVFVDANDEPGHGHAPPWPSVSPPLSPPSPSRYSTSSGFPTRPPSYASEKPNSEGGDALFSSPSPAPPLPRASRHRPTLASFFFRSAGASPSHVDRSDLRPT